jgi:exodeoxyribonuclease V alpha subunit
MPRLDVKDNDFFFMPRESDAAIAATVAQLCATRLPKTYGEIAVKGTQVICPSRKGESGTENLNVILQAQLNPPAKGKKEYRFRETVFREGDRVMQTRNNYDIEWEKDDGSYGTGVFNGDVGTIVSIDTARSVARIVFDDKSVEYELNMLDELEPAYAVTVHKSQGCEYPIVIIPLGSAPSMLYSRNLFYTAVTRAQKMVILVGREEVARMMVQNQRQSMRYTGLAEWLRKSEE